MTWIPPNILPSGTTWAEFQAGGLSGHLERLISANSGGTAAPAAAATISLTGGGQSISNPSSAVTVSNNGASRTIAKPTTAVTLSATGGGSSGGSLCSTTTTFYVANTWVTANGGETTVGSSQASVSVASGDIPSVTIPSLPTGVVSANIYVGTTTGVLFLYKKGITGTVALLDSSTWFGGAAMANAPAAPTLNTTIGPIPAGTYYAACTQYHGHGETAIGSSASTSFTIAANSAPSGAPTGAATTGTGTLAAASTGYYYQVTYVDTWGNETTGVENSSVTALSATGEITVTFHDTAPDWVVSRNLYLTAPNGASGSETLYATGISPTATTYVANVNLWNNNTVAQSAARALLTSGSSASQAPSFTLPSTATGSLGVRLYLSNTGGTNTAFGLYATGIETTTYYATTAPWLNASFTSATFANAKTPPAYNTTIGALAPGAYLLNITQTNGIGETTAPTANESASFAVTSQSNPSNAATGAGSGSSGSLPAGAYFASYAYVDAFGNTTTVGTTEFASAVTITAGQSLVVTFNDTLPGWAASRNLYLTAAGGASGSETLYATGITASTYTCSSATWAGVEAIPAANTTSVDIPRVTLPALQTGNVASSVYLTPAGGASGSEVLYADGITTSTFDLSFAAPGSGTQATVTATVSGGAVTGFTITNPGSGYTSAPVITIAPGQSNQVATATTTITNGQVSAVTLVSGGAGYTSAPSVTVESPKNSLSVAPPSFNSTGFSYVDASGATDNFVYQYVRAGENNNLQMVYNGLRQVLYEFNRGAPVPFSGVTAKERHYATTFALLSTMTNEVGALIDANPGTIRPVTDGGVGTVSALRRSWP